LSGNAESSEKSTKGQRFALTTLGCAKNQVDSEAMRALLVQAGHRQVTQPEKADLLVVNTCGFIESAKQESIDMLLELGEQKRAGQKLIATGCLVERYADDLAAELPELDGLLGARNWASLPNLVERLSRLQPGSSLALVNLAPGGLLDLDMPARVATGPSAYVKISDGCNQKCSFCAIPSMKGLLQSKSPELVLREIGDLVRQGVKEIVLVSQDSTNYGRDLGLKENGLADLLVAITDSYPELPWIRIMYAYPAHLTDRLLRTMAERPQVCAYLDMPLQHTHPATLRRMRRPHRPVEEVVGWLRESVPELTLRTTFIVGFPGETEAEFQHLLDSVSRLEFDRVGVFTYSDEEGTPSFNLPDRVPPPIKERRRRRVMEVARRRSLERNRAYVGRTLEVLVEGAGRLGQREVLVGRSRRDAPEVDGLVFLHGEAEVGRIVTARVVQALDYDLVGVIESAAR
jgi:ribosomal protein S12 methylthiotransferase